jgi:hypothetical protein
LNSIVLIIYLAKGAALTQLDLVSFGVDAVLLVFLLYRYGLHGLYRQPIARGWMAIAGKIVPQLALATMFLLQPVTTTAFTLVSIATLGVLALVRLVPTLRVFWRDKQNAHLKGLLLGEGGNTLSVVAISAVWVMVQVR